jgi:predicted component of type VI protein secretion system
VGINVFIYQHAPARVPALSNGTMDVERIAETFQGQLVSSSAPVPPGGNEVLSYLDVAAPEGTPLSAFEALSFPQAAQPAPAGVPRMWWAPNGIGLRFGVRFYIVDYRRASDEFEQLQRAIVEALRSPTQPRRTSAASPITIEVAHQEDGLSFRLKADSRQRLQAQGFALPPVGSLNISTTMRDDFEAVHQSFARHVAPLLTNMPLDQLAALGGVQFVRAGGSGVIWELTRPIYTNASTLPELADWARSLLTLVERAKSHELDPTIAAELEQFESRFKLLVDDIDQLPPERNPLALGLEPRPGKILYKDKAAAFLKRAMLAIQPAPLLADQVRRKVLEYVAARNLYEDLSAGPGWPQKFGATSPDLLIEVVWDLLVRNMISASEASKVVRPAVEHAISTKDPRLQAHVAKALQDGLTELKITVPGSDYLRTLREAG